jgi:hypothetical protein
MRIVDECIADAEVLKKWPPFTPESSRGIAHHVASVFQGCTDFLAVN